MKYFITALGSFGGGTHTAKMMMKPGREVRTPKAFERLDWRIIEPNVGHQKIQAVFSLVTFFGQAKKVTRKIYEV